MIGGQASQTASFMALFRALESGRPEAERLFEDPLASAFLDRALRVLVLLAKWPSVRRGLEWVIDALWPGARSSGVARTRLIDDLIAEARTDAGIERVVFLGAGYDTRAHRLACLASLEVIEVDHPNTLRLKRETIASNPGCVGRPPVYLGVDFNRDSLADVWSRAGLDRSCRTLFVWEGVTNYLTAAAVDEVLAFVRAAGPGSRLLFTYVDCQVIDNPDRYRGTRALSWLLRESGEPWTFGIDPSHLTEFLGRRGFELVSDVDSVTYRRRYLAQREDCPVGYEFYRAALVCAI